MLYWVIIQWIVYQDTEGVGCTYSYWNDENATKLKCDMLGSCSLHSYTPPLTQYTDASLHK